MTKKSIFVTGADGFIGSHLIERLVASGHSVRALCQYNSFGNKGWLDTLNQDVLASVDVCLGDIRDGDHVKRLMKNADIVIHLAALIAIPYSYHSPRSYIETNVSGTLNLLQAALDNEVERFIHTSTSEVYGTAQFVPITENTQLLDSRHIQQARLQPISSPHHFSQALIYLYQLFVHSILMGHVNLCVL